ncbi:MAG TPA: NAD(P)-dependent oxidoreductase [Stellaceae bacterium]|jgi:UDP-glucose 4-epimerase|nr:NAD(P)-dependent oxidoreductase [Stellaceae bacterium]
MRILLTGSSGWLGRALAPRLRAAGHVVIGLDVAHGTETQVIGTVADRTLVDRVFADACIEAVIHTAALHKPDIARVPAQAFVDANVTGTLNLLEAAATARHDRFVFTSTTSLMISEAIQREAGTAAVWLDERFGPLAPRNIYGVTKLAAEGLCRLHHSEHSLACVVLRTSRFFPEEDDTHRELPGPNLKANEFLYRRLTVEDAADAHVMALQRAPTIGFGMFIVSAPTPFVPSDAEELKRDAAAVVRRYFPDAATLYARRNWRLPANVGRVYDASKAQRVLGFRCETDFGRVLDALRRGAELPFAHDPTYLSPKERRAAQ